MGPRGATHCSACPALRHSESGPLSLSVRECGAAGSASGQTACPFRPTLRQSRSRHGNVSPFCPGARLCPSYQSGCMFLFISLVSDFLAVQFSVSSGCARRCSVSTYASILVLRFRLFVLHLHYFRNIILPLFCSYPLGCNIFFAPPPPAYFTDILILKCLSLHTSKRPR